MDTIISCTWMEWWVIILIWLQRLFSVQQNLYPSGMKLPHRSHLHLSTRKKTNGYIVKISLPYRLIIDAIIYNYTGVNSYIMCVATEARTIVMLMQSVGCHSWGTIYCSTSGWDNSITGEPEDPPRHGCRVEQVASQRSSRVPVTLQNLV